PSLYQPISGADTPKVLFRAGNPGLAPAIEALAARVQPGTRAQTLPVSYYIDRKLAPSRAGAQIAGLIGLFGLALATIGMFGVFASAVQQRTKEIGIRVALGARPAQVIKLVIAGTSRAVLFGLLAGFVVAASAARVLAGYLHGISPLDPRA